VQQVRDHEDALANTPATEPRSTLGKSVATIIPAVAIVEPVRW
jgi:hypothetical protein